MIFDSRRSGSPSPEAVIDLYLHLATASNQQRQQHQETKFLVLAACAAQDSGYTDIADDCMAKVLAQNASHMLKNYRTMAEAVQSDSVAEYVVQLRKIYPPEKAEYLLGKYRASGYRGQHEFGEQLGMDDSASQVRGSAASQRPKLTSRAVRSTGKKGVVAAGNGAPLDFEPLPLEWPMERRWPEFNRKVAIGFAVGAVVGLIIGLWLGAWFFAGIVSRL